MPVQALRALDPVHMLYPAQEIIGRNIQFLRKGAQIIEGRLTGPAFKVRDGTGRQAHHFRQLLLFEPTVFAGLSEPLAKHVVLIRYSLHAYFDTFD